jgi:RNA polymerase-binding transcription factor DksA
MEHFLGDWRDNCITDKSLICKDHTFFDELTEGAGDTYGTTNVRHGLYAYSSKDWNEIKDQIAEETKKARAEHIQVMKDTGSYKTEEQLELECLEREALALKNRILPSKVKKGAESDFGFGFCDDSQEED